MWLLFVTVFGLVTGNSVDTESRIKLNPEASMNISQIIQYWGYPAEEYEVLTEDGYYLSLNRIPGGSRAAILLVHGFSLEGSSWVENSPNNSLGFILADANYDVWIGNARGTSWSQKHINLTTNQEEFWDFSFHEMGIYDLPAMTDFILQKTGQEKIYYAGHSQGVTVAFIGFSIIPRLAEKTKIIFAFGPGYTLHFSRSPIKALGYIPETFLKIILGRKKFPPLNPRWRKVISRICTFKPLDVLLCKQFFQIIGGFNEKNLNESRTDVYLSRYPDYSSVKNIIHWSQLAKTEQFRYFDYGAKNIEKYNQTTPPFYNIEAITVPIAVWSGGQDSLDPPEEISLLLPRIRSLIYAKEIPDWNHMDFIWGIDAPLRMYREVLCFMEQ